MHHDVYELFVAIVVNLIATVLKFGERTQIGAIHLVHQPGRRPATHCRRRCWGYGVHVTGTGLTPDVIASIVSLSGGALVANVVSVVMLMAETIMQKR